MSKSRESLLSKVAALYAKAASTPYEEEAKAFTAKADMLMLEHQIKEAELLTSGEKKGAVFEIRTVDVPIESSFSALVSMIASHCDCHAAYRGLECVVAGTVHDLDHFEILWTNLMGHMNSLIRPKNDPSKSEAENLFRFRQAGFSWQQTHEKMHPDVPWERRHGVRYTRLVKNYSEKHNLVLNKTGGVAAQENYRQQFVWSYLNRIQERLFEARRGQEEMRQGAEVVLFNQKNLFDEFLYENELKKRPHPSTCDCEFCHRKRCKNKETCQRDICKRMRKPIRSGKARTMAYNHAANQAGKTAANSADLNQTRLTNPKELT